MIRMLLYLVLLCSSTSLLAQSHSRTVGNKSFELSNHLGNVLEVTTDRSLQNNTEAEIVAFNDYYPYGMLMEERYGEKVRSNYRYKFNGAETDDEFYNQEGSSYDLGARIYDPRIGRMRSTDPWEWKYTWQSSYAYFKNSPISKIDWKGFGGPEEKKVEEILQGDNFDYNLNKDKIEYYNDNLSDGGHFQGDERIIKGMNIFYEKRTSIVTTSISMKFETNKQIIEHNQEVEKTAENINTVKSGAVGLASATIPGVGAAQAAIALGTAYADNKLFSLDPIEKKKKKGETLQYNTTTEVFRSTFENSGKNRIQITTSISVLNEEGDVISEKIIGVTNKPMNPIGSSKFSRAEENLMRTFERENGNNIIVTKTSMTMFQILLKRRSEK